jgi:hypothetical protein
MLDHVAAAIRAQAQSPDALALHDGLAGVGWTVAHLADDPNSEELCASIDRGLLRALEREWQGPYDLIGGLVGFGVYALERGEQGHALAGRVLEVLRSKAVSRGRGLAWKTDPKLLPPHQRAVAPHGYWNFGVAHGVPGVVALCARCVSAGTHATAARELMNGAAEFLLDAEPPNDAGRFPPWHTDGGTDGNRARLAWCYGDLGVAAALTAAAQVEPRWQQEARSLARACALRPSGEWLHDAGVCHGAAGIAHTFNRMYQATGDLVLRDAALRWLTVTLEMRNEHAYAGFPAFDGETGGWRADATLLSGAAGIALVLRSMVSEDAPLWDRLLLLDLAASDES